MKKAINYVLFCIPLLGFLNCGKNVLPTTMAEFDKAFIPVLYYTQQGDLMHAKQSLSVLNEKWDALYIQFDRQAPKADHWRTSFKKVSSWLDEAAQALNDGDVRRAFVQLDHARYEMVDLRAKENIDYYLDKIWDLETAIDNVVEVSNDTMLDLLTYNEFLPMTQQIQASWQEVLIDTWEPAYFDFSELEIREEADRKFTLGLRVLDFKQDVQTADRCKIETAVKKLELAYLNYLYLFGDFDNPEYFYTADTK